jgi:Protein of unknown function (DUF4197)
VHSREQSRYWIPALIAGALLLAAASPVAAQLPDAKIADGLKGARKVATEKTVSLTGKTDGYFANQAIKILMPDKLKSLESGLRAVGYGSQIDEFVLSMNRAAESAATQAKQIFVDAIGKMSFDDARKILNGSNTAATDFFKSKTTPQLTTAFKPAVSNSMNDVGVTRQYKDLVGRFEPIPFAKSQAFDLDGYVVDKGLAGLFHVLGEQEQQIRTNPTARVTDLLKEVFKR